MTCAGCAIGSAASRPEKRIKLEVDLEPAPFSKRVSHPPFARGGYNSEEWVFDDEDDDDLPAEQHEYGDQDDPRHYSAGGPDDSIRSLEVRLCFCLPHWRFTFSCHGRCLQLNLGFNAKACLLTLLQSRRHESTLVAFDGINACTIRQDWISNVVVEDANRLSSAMWLVQSDGCKSPALISTPSCSHTAWSFKQFYLHITLGSCHQLGGWHIFEQGISLAAITAMGPVMNFSG